MIKTTKNKLMTPEKFNTLFEIIKNKALYLNMKLIEADCDGEYIYPEHYSDEFSQEEIEIKINEEILFLYYLGEVDAHIEHYKGDYWTPPYTEEVVNRIEVKKIEILDENLEPVELNKDQLSVLKKYFDNNLIVEF